MNGEDAIALFLIDLAILIVLSRVLGWALAKVHQPPVLGEILAGILIGPSLLGWVSPGTSAALFPSEVNQLLEGMGNAGLALFAFLIGLGLDLSLTRLHLRTVARVSAGAFLVPFIAGAILALPLHESHSMVGGQTIPLLSFAFFISTALSVTAFPVLFRILADQGLTDTPLGVISITSAGVLDLLGWILLGLALLLLGGGGSGILAGTGLGLLLFGVTMRFGVIPLLRRGVTRGPRETEVQRLSLVVALALGSAGFTQLIGLNSVLGALVLGLAFPREKRSGVIALTRQAITPMTEAVLLPVYFAVSGMSVDITGLRGNDLVELVVITVLATIAKVGGAASGARWAGLPWRDGLPLGILMNTRGLMEIVVLNVGYEAGLLDKSLYSELVLVALIATFMTGPALACLRSFLSGPIWRQTAVSPLGSSRAA